MSLYYYAGMITDELCYYAGKIIWDPGWFVAQGRSSNNCVFISLCGIKVQRADNMHPHLMQSIPRIVLFEAWLQLANVNGHENWPSLLSDPHGND